MFQTVITDREAGQRFDKYLRRILPEAGNGFLYKMLRKKNITLNDKKADGSEKIAAGDSVKIYFSDETLAKFKGSSVSGGSDSDMREGCGGKEARRKVEPEPGYLDAYRQLSGIQIIYENDHVLLADKPAGILSQRAERTDRSLNEWLVGYLLDSGFIKEEELTFYKPSVCNRLDRNTSGIVLCAKSLLGARLFSQLLKDRTLHKYYRAYVKGTVNEEQLIEGYLQKDEARNKVFITPGPVQAAYIRTAYKPVRVEKDKTLLEAELITGKPHQLRAHLASVGHPILGDYKYGDKTWNEEYRKKYHVKSQLLHAHKVEFPQLEAPFRDISGKTFYAGLPDVFRKVSCGS